MVGKSWVNIGSRPWSLREGVEDILTMHIGLDGGFGELWRTLTVRPLFQTKSRPDPPIPHTPMSWSRSQHKRSLAFSQVIKLHLFTLEPTKNLFAYFIELIAAVL